MPTEQTVSESVEHSPGVASPTAALIARYHESAAIWTLVNGKGKLSHSLECRRASVVYVVGLINDNALKLKRDETFKQSLVS